MGQNKGAAIGLGLAFAVVFWLVFDNLALGVALGVAMGVAFSNVKPLSVKTDDVEKTQDSTES